MIGPHSPPAEPAACRLDELGLRVLEAGRGLQTLLGAWLGAEERTRETSNPSLGVTAPALPRHH